MCTTFILSYEGLIACRFFLGQYEGGMVHKSLAGTFGGLPAAGLTKILDWGTSNCRIRTWRNIFFEGRFTLILAGLGTIVLPSAPNTCKFLTPRDQSIALERINR
ncbi:hypothetical protein BJ878DRAFT_539923 [Calycina marina]|uniref:Uncharacterized protein n=1 Tax=Calycina marina TaxID=1763456 RepID=A0A9P7Z7M5_9HELO|nr:hypothetical protein BJ878DRAFT_539923 [Calycina marina]